MRFALEPKPNEPRGDILLPTVGPHARVHRRARVPGDGRAQPGVRARDDVGPVVPPRGRADAVARQALPHRPQRASVPGKYDQDFRFGSEGIRDAFYLVKLLEDAGWDGMRHFDAHAYRTEDADGVWDFARGCMRTYLILQEKARALPRGRRDPGRARRGEGRRARRADASRGRHRRAPRPTGPIRSRSRSPGSAWNGSTSSSPSSCSASADRVQSTGFARAMSPSQRADGLTVRSNVRGRRRSGRRSSRTQPSIRSCRAASSAGSRGRRRRRRWQPASPSSAALRVREAGIVVVGGHAVLGDDHRHARRARPRAERCGRAPPGRPPSRSGSSACPRRRRPRRSAPMHVAGVRLHTDEVVVRRDVEPVECGALRAERRRSSPPRPPGDRRSASVQPTLMSPWHRLDRVDRRAVGRPIPRRALRPAHAVPRGSKPPTPPARPSASSATELRSLTPIGITPVC